MNSRDRVLTSLRHIEPDRVPFGWGFGPTEEMTVTLNEYYASKGINFSALKSAVSDIVTLSPDFVNPECGKKNFWGINVVQAGYEGGNYNEFCNFPLAGIETPEQIRKYTWPDPELFNYDTFTGKIENANPGRTKAVLCYGGNPFEIYCWLTGLEDALVNLLVNPEVVRAALDCISGFFEKQLRYMLKASGRSIDLILFADDLGSQTGLLLSVDAYRSVIQPYHRRLTGCVKELAPHVHSLFHSDGAVFDVLPALIESGFDVLEAVQIETSGMAPERLKDIYGSSLCFHGAISVQGLLPHASPEEVRCQCKNLISILGKNGGYIAAPSHAIQIGTPPGNVEAMLAAVLGDDEYNEILAHNRFMHKITGS